MWLYFRIKMQKCVTLIVVYVLTNIAFSTTKADNQSQSTSSDCFEHIVSGAMLPFERTFRNDDINSLKTCQEICIKEGERCQIISFGVHIRGNGTCQLSSEKINTSQLRPSGTIFDPDFDLYARKLNCFDIQPEGNTISQIGISSNNENFGTSSATINTKNDLRPTLIPVSTIESENMFESSQTINPSTNNITPQRNNFTNFMQTLSDTVGQKTDDTIIQPTTFSPHNKNNAGYDYLNVFLPTYHQTQPIQNDSIYSSADNHSVYPGIHEDNISGMGNNNNRNNIPNLYYPDSHRTTVTTINEMNHGQSSVASTIFTTTSYNNNKNNGSYLNSRPHFDQPTTYSPYNKNRIPPPITHPPPYHPRYPEMNFNNLPPSNYNGHRIESNYPSVYSDDNQNTQGYIPSSDNFNQPRYPSENGYSHFPGYNRPDDYIRNKYSSCFRRVLAGKRIAPQWVRKTLVCEQIEDCMQECNNEKRFVCEGFNFHLDPSGHSHGECELIDVPLSEIDFYSSPHSRDSNLLRHPDYDYYERDRNAHSSCRQVSCKDCEIKQHNYNRPYDEHYLPHYVGGSYDKNSDSRHSQIYESRPPQPHYPVRDYHYGFSPHSNEDNAYGTQIEIDRYDDDSHEPNQWKTQGHGIRDDYHNPPPSYYNRPSYRPGSYSSSYKPVDDYSRYHDRHKIDYKKPTSSSHFIPYLNSAEDSPTYGGNYGGSSHAKDYEYWGLKHDSPSKTGPDFNYFDLGNNKRKYEHNGNNYIWNYPGSRYGFENTQHYSAPSPPARHGFSSQWTRRAGPEECSVKFGEGFRLHKTAVRHSCEAPTLTECERLCYTENRFTCHTYSYRYSTQGRENCLLCDRPINSLDYYIDIEPDRDFDIYSMADDLSSCKYPSSVENHSPIGDEILSKPRSNAQCFFRAIDATRFFKSIVRDSLTVRSVGECELECIKITKFTCRAFAFRYGQKSTRGIIDNCQLSDWPVRDMDKERHLVLDPSFDIFERASYGHGCEIQPIIDEKHKKLCYLGYGSPAKLLSTAIKKAIYAPTETDCKNECIRFRETTSFKCFSFSFGSHESTANCEMSDLDQTQLKLNIHYAHTNEREYWLFAWYPYDWTCRDMIATVGGNRANNNRRVDVFRDHDETWRFFTVSGKPCRSGNQCDKNLITGFYSCELEGGEIGSWDYCCKADHPCGYSQGLDYSWCFVGDEPGQWRKCSDKFFPSSNKHHNSNYTQQPHPGISYSQKGKKKNIHQSRDSNRHNSEISTNINDFALARLWPVTYLYSEGPPNSSALSNFVDCNKDTC